MNISIFASIWSQNLGDELILKNEIQLLREEFWEDTQFQVASYDPKNPFFQDENTDYFEYFPIWIRNPKNIARNIKNLWSFIASIIWSDIVVIGWGGIIYDSEKQSNSNPLNQWIFRISIARLFRKKIYFYALWVDIKDGNNTWKLKKIFKNAWKVTVRDSKSQKQLQAIGVSSEIVDDPVMIDSATSFSSGRERIQDWVTRWWTILWSHPSKIFQISDLKNYDLRGKKVGLALRSWYFWKDPEWEQVFIEELCGYIESRGSKIIFLPHSFHSSDSISNDYLFLKQFMTDKREMKESMKDVYACYTHKLTHLNITMRLHSMILSYIYDIEQVTLSYSTKTDELVKKLSE